MFLSNLSTANEVDLVASLGKAFLAKGTVRSNNNLIDLKFYQEIYLTESKLDNWALLGCIFVKILATF